MQEQADAPVAVARLVGSTATSGRRHAYLSAGSSSGVKPGMPVLSERGVVGRVLETGRNSSRVLLLTDSESVLPVAFCGSGWSIAASIHSRSAT